MLKRSRFVRPHPRFGLLHLRPGTWQSEVASLVRGESEQQSIDRLLAALPNDQRLQQEATAAVDGWAAREQFLLERGFPAQRDREQQYITALQGVGA
jgi:hypothetical protein